MRTRVDEIAQVLVLRDQELRATARGICRCSTGANYRNDNRTFNAFLLATWSHFSQVATIGPDDFAARHFAPAPARCGCR